MQLSELQLTELGASEITETNGGLISFINWRGAGIELLMDFWKGFGDGLSSTIPK